MKEKKVNSNDSQSLRGYLNKLKKEIPQGLVTITKKVNPDFEVSAILKHLEDLNKFPAVLFENISNLKGQYNGRLAINIGADRKRLALAIGLSPEDYKSELTIESSRRASLAKDVNIVKSEDAPVREVIFKGKDIDLRNYPMLKYHELDGGNFFTSPVVAKDPLTGIYNSSIHRLMYRDKDETGINMSPFHLYSIHRKNERRNKPTPVAVVLGHHPAFFIASDMRVPFESDELRITGGLLGEALKMVPSETWGDELLVPSEAEMILEGEILPNRLEAEGPFGEWTGYDRGQGQSQIFKVKAITQRKDPIIVSVFSAHREHIVMTIGWEIEALNRVKSAVPNVKAVSLPANGLGVTCYISIEKSTDGEPKLAALAAASVGFIKTVVVVDSDIDVFNQNEVMWALAVRFQAHRDADIVREVQGSTADPSSETYNTHSTMLIDATEPMDVLNPKRVTIPTEVLEKIKLKDYISPDILKSIE
ncbi:MAG: UbiD family decarboxylase [Actinobacteria bacterium]|nr:UbiD family decarboxylase [Actinomycetota bacterium]